MILRKGFTILEIIVVVLIIGIIATISYVYWNVARDNALVASLKADVTNAAHTIDGEFALTNSVSYFTSLSQYNNGSDILPSSGNTFVYTVNNNSNPVAYCISAYNGSKSYMLSSTVKNATAGFCGTSGLVTNGLVADLDAGEATSYPGSGTTWYDLSGNSNNGTLVNSPSVYSDSLGFNGSTSYVNLGQNFNYTSQDFTVAMWIYINSYTTNVLNQGPIPYYKGPYQVSGYYGSITATGQATFITNQSGANQMTTSSYSSIPLGTWLYWVTVRSGSSATIYVNANNSNLSNATHTNPASAISDFYLANYSNYIYSNMKIGRFSMYNRALSSSEITQMYTTTRTRYGV